MKKCGIYAVISIIGLGSLLRVSILRAKENQIDIKSYIGQTYETLPKELEQKCHPIGCAGRHLLPKRLSTGTFIFSGGAS